MKRKATLKPGGRFRFLSRYRLCHVLAVTKVERDVQVVTYRWFNRASGRWLYEVETADQINQARFAVRGAEPLYGKPAVQAALFDETCAPMERSDLANAGVPEPTP